MPGNAAERIIERFGGIRPMASKLEVPVTTVQGWKKRGAIPTNRHLDLLAAAARHDIKLDPAELEAAAPADERGHDHAQDAAEPEAVAIPPAIEEPGAPRHATVVDGTGVEPIDGADRARAGATAADPAPATHLSEPATDRRPDRVEDAAPMPVHRPEPRRGGGLGATALAVSLLALAGAATSPWWAPGLLTPVLGPPGGAATEQRLAQLDQRIQQIANRPATPVPPAMGGAGADGAPSAFERRIAEIEQRLQQGAAPGAAPGVGSPDLERRFAELEQRLQAPAPNGAAGGQSADEVRQLSRRVDQIAQSVQQVQAGGGQLSALAQELAQLRERTAALAEQVARRRDDETRAQALALAAAQVRAAVQTSGPYRTEVEALKAFEPQDPRLVQAMGALDAHAATGVPTAARLAERFGQISGDIVRAGSVGEDGSWTDRALSRVTSLVSIRRPAEQAEGDGASAIVSRAEARLDEGDLAAAVEELSGLQGPALETAGPWLADARARLAVDEAAATLTGAALSRLSGGAGAGSSQAEAAPAPAAQGGTGVSQ
jgi:hypothetical protein